MIYLTFTILRHFFSHKKNSVIHICSDLHNFVNTFLQNDMLKRKILWVMNAIYYELQLYIILLSIYIPKTIIAILKFAGPLNTS